jgi:hypothetical protein
MAAYSLTNTIADDWLIIAKPIDLPDRCLNGCHVIGRDNPQILANAQLVDRLHLMTQCYRARSD